MLMIGASSHAGLAWMRSSGDELEQPWHGRWRQHFRPASALYPKHQEHDRAATQGASRHCCRCLQKLAS